MTDHLVDFRDGFWNIRGSFKLGGLVEIGTQCSLVQRSGGGFVVLDAYAAEDSVHRAILDLTDGGRAIEAVLNLHPFHTVHCHEVARRFPDALHYGTARHKRVVRGVPWQELETDDPALWDRFADDLHFSVPRGVELIPTDEKLHFASVLAFHPRSATLHVDDTLTWNSLPLIGGLGFHPTLRHVLERRAGAAAEFRGWAEELIAQCVEVDHLCTAHMRTLPPDGGRDVASRVREAYEKVDSLLERHARRYG